MPNISESPITVEELVSRASALVPLLQERHQSVDEKRCIPAESVNELSAAGMYSLSAPREYGGYALPMADYVDVMAELSKGCSSTAWVAAIANSTSYLAGICSQRAQDEVFAGGANRPLASVPQAKMSTARFADGGVHIEHARWFFNSGVTLSDWVINGVVVSDDDGTPLDLVMCLIPTSELTLHDDWFTIGMRGTQSVSTEARDVFVPNYRAVSSLAVLGGMYKPIYGLDQPLYHSAAVPALSMFVAPCGIGIAEAALDRFVCKAQGRAVTYTTIENQADDSLVHGSVGEARLKIDSARALLKTTAANIDSWARRGEMMPTHERIRARAACSYGLTLCWEAVDRLYSLSGGSVINEFEPMQRYWRDMKTATMHGLLTPSSALTLQGRIDLHREPNAVFV